MQSPPGPLASAAAVCRSQLHLAALPHVAEAISGFLDCSVHWSLAAACGFACDHGALRLVQRVAAHEALAVARARRTLARLNEDAIPDATRDAALVLRRQQDPFFRQQQFTLGMARAAARGDTGVMQWLAREFPGCYVTRAVEEAARSGQLAALQWLHIRDAGGGLAVCWGAKELFYAGQNGHLHVVEWLQAHTHPTPTHMFFVTLEEAAKNGDLAMVKWLCDFGHDRLQLFAVGKFYTLQWLKQESILEDLPESERHYD
ncbi:uncharacterized protein IUM83_02139 [Phytophthora cinnamomi]|uniref:uncharacterized protein n=1 Tax=Phytophthora cinnamomi TaxID=4785 RepID=UPI0035598404|nr:hypothetical protein IUM83_02139 [Phytophthora cinnamomi]